MVKVMHSHYLADNYSLTIMRLSIDGNLYSLGIYHRPVTLLTGDPAVVMLDTLATLTDTGFQLEASTENLPIKIQEEIIAWLKEFAKTQ